MVTCRCLLKPITDGDGRCLVCYLPVNPARVYEPADRDELWNDHFKPFSKEESANSGFSIENRP